MNPYKIRTNINSECSVTAKKPGWHNYNAIYAYDAKNLNIKNDYAKLTSHVMLFTKSLKYQFPPWIISLCKL